MSTHPQPVQPHAPTRADYAAFAAELFTIARRLGQAVNRWIEQTLPPPPQTLPEPAPTGDPQPQPPADPPAAHPDLKQVTTATTILKRLVEITHLLFRLQPPTEEYTDPFPYSHPDVLREVFGDEEE